MGRLAIVIPSVASVEELETTLVAVLQNRPPQCEVAVVHAHPYDDPYELAGEVQFIAAQPGDSYLACVAQGLQAVAGSVVHVLAAGCQVHEGWTDGILRHFNDPRVALVAPLLLSPRDAEVAVAADMNYLAGGLRRVKSRSVADMAAAGVSPILAASPLAVFYNRHVLETVGSLHSDLGLDAADVDLGLRLRHAGFRSLVDPRRQVILGATLPEQVSPFQQARRAEQLFWRNAPLAGWGRSLLAHPLAVMASAMGSLPFPAAMLRLAGHIAGLATAPAALRYHQRLADLHNSAPQPVYQSHPHVRFDRGHQPTAKAA